MEEIYISKIFGSPSAIEMFDRQIGYWLFAQNNETPYNICKVPPKYMNHFVITVQFAKTLKKCEVANEMLNKQIKAIFEASLRSNELVPSKDKEKYFYVIDSFSNKNDNSLIDTIDIKFYKEV